MGERSQLQERILGRRVAEPEDDPDAADDCGAFGHLRGVRERAVMLEFRLGNGNREAFPYALLERVGYDPSDGLTLWFLGAKVTLAGRNLARPAGTGVSLLDALLRHRLSWVAETDELRAAVALTDVAVVTAIQIAAAQ